MKSTFTVTLPQDLIAEILLNLSVKSLIRFKCVSKSWLSLISDPQFAKSHFDLAIQPTHRVLLKSADDSKVNSIEVNAPLLQYSTALEFNIPQPQIHGRSVGIVGSCRGFILLIYYVCFDQAIDFVIWNPSTGFRKQIDIVARSMRHAYLYGIGYDSLTDDYAVVIVKLPQILGEQLGTVVHCFSSRTNSWCCTKDTVTHYQIGYGFNNGLLLNGVLHWLVKSDDYHRVIIAFDVMEKRLSRIPMPHDVDVRTSQLRAMGGYLCLYLMDKRSGIDKNREIWIMKEYRVQSSWTKSFVLSSDLFYRPHLFFRICFTQNDEGELLELHKLHTREKEKGIFRIVDTVMYRESLLSLPGSENTEGQEKLDSSEQTLAGRPKRNITKPIRFRD